MRRRRTRQERLRDVEEAAERSLRGESVPMIAQALGVSPSQVSRDLKRKDEEWMAEARKDTALLKARELARLREAQAAYFQAWEESKVPRERTFRRGAPGKSGPVTTVTVRTEPGEGRPEYLAGVLRLIRQRNRPLRLSGKPLERFEREWEEKRRLEEERALARAASGISLLRQVERVYGPIQAWLGLRCPETPGEWWGIWRIFGPGDWPTE